MSDHHSPAFGEAVQAVLRQRGLTLRSQRIRTGIDHTTMKSMCDGFKPRVEKVEQFARGLGLDVNEWRMKAGYLPVETSGDYFLRQLKALAEELGLDAIPVEFFSETGEPEEFTIEQADQLIASIRRQLTRTPDG